MMGLVPVIVGFAHGTEMAKGIVSEAIAQEPRRVYTLRIHTCVQGNRRK